MNKVISASEGTGERVVVLRPVDAVTLRQIERALIERGITSTVARPLGELYISCSDLPLLQQNLNGWKVIVEDSLAQKVQANQQRASQAENARASIATMLETSREDLLRILPSAHRLDTHQLQAVAAIVQSGVGGISLFDEQGLGKTATALWAFHYLRTGDVVDRMLVLAPKNMIFEWVHEAAKFLEFPYVVQAVHGSEREKRISIKKEAHIYVTNYETATRLEIALRNLLRRSAGRSLLVVDESFFVKNGQALRTAAVRRLRVAASRCIILCGTPAPNSANDIIEQINIADQGATFGGMTFPEDRQKKVESINRVLAERGAYIRRLKREVMPGLPGKDFSQVSVPMEPQQLQMYREHLNSLVDDVRITSDANFERCRTSFIARRIRLLQICSHPGVLNPNYGETPSKVLALDALLRQYIEERHEKIVLWSFFRFSLQNLFERFKKYNPVRIDGSVSDARLRSVAIRQFQEDDSTMLFIANPAAAGAGITLTRACTALYESFSMQAAHYLQSLDRIHRRGQSRDVTYHILLCQGSIEESHFERLLEKERAGRDLLRDKEPPTITRELFLADLLSSLRKL